MTSIKFAVNNATLWDIARKYRYLIKMKERKINQDSITIEQNLTFKFSLEVK